MKACKVTGGDWLAVVGESHYQSELDAACGGRTKEGHEVATMALLVGEAHNEHDPHAVSVWIDCGGEMSRVGYLSRIDGARYSPLLLARAVANQSPIACDAMIRGGWDRGAGDIGHYGISVQLPTPQQIAEQELD